MPRIPRRKPAKLAKRAGKRAGKKPHANDSALKRKSEEYSRRGLELERRGKFPEAFEAYKGAAVAEFERGNFPRAGMFFEKAREFDGAIAAYEKARDRKSADRVRNKKRVTSPTPKRI